MDTLLNTSWQLAFAPVVSGSVTYAVTLECQGVTYNSLMLDATSGRILYDSTPVYYEGWLNSNYRQIKFTGGTDIEDADLIAWVEANANPSLTQKEIFERNMTALREAINVRAATTGSKTIPQMIAAVESITVPVGNQDISNTSEYNVVSKATARISAAERAKIKPQNIAKGVTILGVSGSHEGGAVSTDAFNELARCTITEVTADMLEGCSNIRNYLFYDCSQLSRVEFPENADYDYIGNGAFMYCNSLTSLSPLPENLIAIGSDAFRGAGISSITIPNAKMSSIGDRAFFNSAIESIDIPVGRNLTLGEEVFRFCTLLERVIYRPNKPIPKRTFLYCERLMSLTLTADNVITLGEDALLGVPADCAIYVPANKVAAYKANSSWQATGRTNYIQAIPEENS